MTDQTPSPQSVVVPVDRGVAGVIMDGLWPILGGNHTDAEVWTEIGEVVSSALAAAPAPSGGEVWRDPSEIPEAKKGEHAYRIVAVKRADGKKVVTFSAFYMNAVPLWFEDDNESRNVTGWHSDSEGDDGPTYSPLLMGGDVLMGWREFPRWEAALSPEAPAREGVNALRTALIKARSELAIQYCYSAGRMGIAGCYPELAEKYGGSAIVQEIDAVLALTPRHEAPAPTCQKCGGEVQGWTCQECGASFRENDEGSLVFACHEAPAEGAGERDYPAEFEAWWMTYQNANREKADYNVKKQIAFDAFYHGARSSAPEAREDAQPFAWAYRLNFPDENTAWDWQAEKEKMTEAKFGQHGGILETMPLYTHPAAPSADKLRIAVEAFQSVKRHSVLGSVNFNTAVEALAALKAEGA